MARESNETDLVVVAYEQDAAGWRADAGRHREAGEEARADECDTLAAKAESYGREGLGTRIGAIPRAQFADPRAPQIAEFKHPAPLGEFHVLRVNKDGEGEPCLLPVVADRPAEETASPEVANLLVAAAKEARRKYAREVRREGHKDVVVMVHARPGGTPKVYAATREIARAAAEDAGLHETRAALREPASPGNFLVLFFAGAEGGVVEMRR
jgi:hypothetical protein